MVCLGLLDQMRSHYKEKLPEYVKKHPGEFVLLEQGRGGIKESFYNTEFGLHEATEKYKGLFGPTFVCRRIPYSLPKE